MLRTASMAELEGSLSKRRRGTHSIPLSEFQPGSIVRCKLVNFMSYGLSEFHFGPKMNMIIGPNGSGKSTFVCAVCIGLGGKMEYLDKAGMTVDQFIKTGENDGSIELEMKGRGDDESIVVTRDMVRGAKSAWRVNGNPSTESAVHKLLADYNIQLSNLCQFLPQDRVARFASLKPEELLKEIERTYKTGELLEQHEQLIGYYAERQEAERRLAELQNRLKALQEKHDELQQHAETMREYKKLEEDLAKFECARGYATLQSLKRKRDELKLEYQAAGKRFEAYKAEIAPWKETLQSSDVAAQQISGEVEDLKQQKKSCEVTLEKGFDSLEKYAERIAKWQEKKAYIATRMETLLRKVENYQQELAKHSKALEGIETVSDEEYAAMKTKRDQLEEESIEADEPLSGVRDEYDSRKREVARYEDRIRDTKKQLGSSDRLYSLDQRYYGRLIECVRRMRDEQNKPAVYEPAIVSVRVTDKRCGPVLEKLVRRNNLTAFIARDQGGYHWLSDFLYKRTGSAGRGSSIRTLGVRFNPQPDVPVSEVKALGFDGYVSDFIEGPPEVVRLLCEQEGLHKIPVMFDECAPNKLKGIVDQVTHGKYPFARFAVHDSVYSFRRSAFGQRQTTTVIQSIPMRHTVFGEGISEEQRHRVEESVRQLEGSREESRRKVEILSEQLKTLVQKKEEVKAQLEEVREKMRAQKRLIKARTKLEMRVETLQDLIRAEKRNIKAIKSSGTDNEMQKALVKIRHLEAKRLETLKELAPQMQQISAVNEQITRKKLLLLEAQNRADSIQGLEAQIEDTLKSMRQAVEEVRRKYTDSRVVLSDERAKYTAEIRGYSEEKRAEVQAAVAELEQRGLLSIEKLAEEIDKVKSKMRLKRSRGGQFSLEMLEDNERGIEEVQQDLPQHEEAVAGVGERMKAVEAAWKPVLESVVLKIAQDFGQNLRKVASAGDVQLDTESENYSEWKLRILVSFRDGEDLVQLNAAQQSGGEKSVTTAVFLNSLQGLTSTPFRIVDEINQGMDATNERKVHKMIVKKTTGSENAAQYFLITPKLLTGLYYSENMIVHCIFAGRWVPEGQNKPKFLEMGLLRKYLKARG